MLHRNTTRVQESVITNLAAIKMITRSLSCLHKSVVLKTISWLPFYALRALCLSRDFIKPIRRLSKTMPLCLNHMKYILRWKSHHRGPSLGHTTENPTIPAMLKTISWLPFDGLRALCLSRDFMKRISRYQVRYIIFPQFNNYKNIKPKI